MRNNNKLIFWHPLNLDLDLVIVAEHTLPLLSELLQLMFLATMPDLEFPRQTSNHQCRLPQFSQTLKENMQTQTQTRRGKQTQTQAYTGKQT